VLPILSSDCFVLMEKENAYGEWGGEDSVCGDKSFN